MGYLYFTIGAYLVLTAVSAVVMTWNMTVGSLFFMVSGFVVMWSFMLNHKKKYAKPEQGLAEPDDAANLGVAPRREALEPKPEKAKRGSAKVKRHTQPLSAELETDLRTIAVVNKTEVVKQVQVLTGMELSEARTYVEVLQRR